MDRGIKNGVSPEAEELIELKDREERYEKWVRALGEMYHIRCYIDLMTGTHETIKENDPSDASIPEGGAFIDAIRAYCNANVFVEDRGEYFKKLSPEYIASRVNPESKSYTFDYRELVGEGARWVRGMVTLVDTGDDGEPRHVVYTAHYIDQEKEEKILLESSLGLMRDTYYRIGCIDLNHNSMRTICISESERGESGLFSENFRAAIRDFANDYVLPEYRDQFLNVMLPEQMRAIFDSGADYFDITYRRYESGVATWVRTELAPLEGYSPENRRVMWYVKNISEEKALEERFSQQLLKMNTDSNLRIKTILDGISGGFKISNDDERYTFYYIGDAAARLFGYSLEEFTEVTHNSAIEVIYPADREEAVNGVTRDLAGGESYSVKYRVQCKDGNLKWIVDSGKRVVSDGGKVLLYSFYHDVTELEEHNERLKDALMMISYMVRSLGCGIFAYEYFPGEPIRKILVMNDEAKRLFGCLGQENLAKIDIGRIMRENIYPEDLAEVGRATATIREPGDSVFYEFRIHHADGKLYRVQVKSELLEFEGGKRFILSSMLDITEKSELYDILKEERARYQEALLSDCEYAYSFDLTAGLIERDIITKEGVNLFRELGLTLPVSFDEMTEKWVESFRPEFLTEESDRCLTCAALRERFLNGEQATELEYRTPATDRYTRVTALTSQSERNGHIMAIVFATDTTERKRMENQTRQALLEAYEAAKRANSAKSDFLSRMSHDIRTPLNAIIGMTAIAGTHLDDTERIKDCLGKITVSAGHLLGLINEVLDMSKIESGKIDLNEEEFNLSDLVDALILMIRPQIKAKGQELNVSIKDVAHERVIGDRSRIQQSFLNFLSNAIKYTPDGGTIGFYITEKGSRHDRVGWYEFVFEDTGIGMTPEFAAHIFEPFTRAKDTRVNEIQGTGLGMAIADNLVRMMNGSIKVESELNKGSRFIVTMSLKLQESEDASYDDFIDLPVLVADDDPVTRENACRILDEMGMKSEAVKDGREAVDRAIERHEAGDDFFAVILDWRMPNLDGIGAAREIRRAIGPDVPIIIISAYDWSDIELEARAAGADAFIGKPLFKSRFARLFRDMLTGGEDRYAADDVKDILREDFAGCRALLVEDNELNAEIAGELLNMMNVEVEYAVNGQEAVDRFAASEPNYFKIIFMDIQMPVLNGNEATRAIRALSRRDAKGIPIIAMTANAFSDDIKASMEAGMNEHIAKPLDLKQFVKVLRRWLR
ncbi:MAG: response regulator [Bacteroides sp.]|nr:response regulator [Eubacterium sp.]MCM1417682.1 response regulator [Roseburia sp.]MCM1461852.1 response regulator [Bacteroides sp.]